ncbi:MAG: A24 family peptidase [Andreesenia angusta]|nr:A24 family peptidase [Andreesenia angusta]
MDNIIKSIIISILLIISIIDYKKMIIPDGLVSILIIISLIYHYNEFNKYQNINSIIESIKGFSFIIISFSLIYFIKKDSIGHGDFKLFLAIALLFNFKDMIMIFIMSFNIAAVISALLIVFKKKTRNDIIPFAPFISISTILVILYSNQIIQRIENLIIMR